MLSKACLKSLKFSTLHFFSAAFLIRCSDAGARVKALPSAWAKGGKTASLLWFLTCSLECASPQRTVPVNTGGGPTGGTFFHGCSCLHSTHTSVYILISGACHMLTFLLYTMDAKCSLLNSIVVFFSFRLWKINVDLLFPSLSELQEARKIILKLLIQWKFPDLYFMLLDRFL